MQEKKNFCTNYLTKSWMDLDRNWYAVLACEPDDPHIHFNSSDQSFKEKPNFGDSYNDNKQKVKCWPAFIHVQTNVFQI